MIDKIIIFSVRSPITIGVLMLILVIYGGMNLQTLSVDAVPDVTTNQVDIITNTPSLATLEMEMFVTAPIEMAMSNIPNLVEARSVSKFGLSVVKLVFTDDTDIYWARQQVFERLEQVQAEIPPGVGKPYMGPVSTGLGEVFQYVIRPKDPADKSFSLMEIRTLQDWVIRKKLLGTPGIAEVSGFGGFKKEYQSKLKLDRMRALGVTVDEIYEALSKGNSNTGGAYIEKDAKAFTIRGIGLATGLDEIAETVVKVNDRTPVLVRDVAEVELGNSIRYGAITMNGNGEAVGGIIMMMKGANGSEVITRIKEKFAEIEKELPEGLVIEPFIDRSKLVNNAIKTVATNLIEGALIVVIVILAFLGNWRASLLAASVIPLAMLFAFIWMNQFSVVGNIMSLGAIDFGLLVDPAIIVVESVVMFLAMGTERRMIERQLHDQDGDHHASPTFSYAERQDLVISAVKEVKKSVVFGGMIILIVYFPILTLQGVEGKMFIPMAKTVSFAILGALLLSITYVPMMSALVMRPPKDPHDHGLAEKVVNGIFRGLEPIIRLVLRVKPVAILFAAAVLTAGVVGFSRIGGEFIPKLQEGDMVIEINLPVGASMSECLKLSDKIQKVLWKEYPDEVERIVSKIGTSEVPVDPMPMEAQEMVVVLKDKKVWKKAPDQETLSALFSETLKAFPGIVVSIQQPIENRVNELMSGARTDVVVKLFGYNLDTMVTKGNQIIGIIRGVPGAVDVQENKIFGLPQINIVYDRKQLAVYGITVEQMNRVIQMAFAGAVTGIVYEKDKRFDLTMRLSEDDRRQIENIKNLLISDKDNNPIPLRELADIRETVGPSEIGHENLKRRMNIGFNVRGRDLESVVNDVIARVDKQVLLTKDYTLEYGGEFENFRRAKERLGIVVPIALFIIFCLLYVTFGNVKDSLLIYATVPLSAIGGVFALLLRDMNFSISAGVGFIALFGVAVLNGILLVSHFNELMKQGFAPEPAVLQGLRERFRPVLMTSAVAALGFMPMALSTSVGAEVQKPLATVVIGGLFTATLLTLIVLPVIYTLVKGGSPLFGSGKPKTPKKAVVATVLLALATLPALAQSPAGKPISLQEALSTALTRNPEMGIATKRIEQQQVLKPAAFNLENPIVRFEAPNGDQMRGGIYQNLDFPSVYTSQLRAQEKRVELAMAEKDITTNGIVYRVKTAYNDLQFFTARYNLLRRMDSVYADIIRVNDVRYKVGQIDNLARVNGEAQYKRIQFNLKQAIAELSGAKAQLTALLGRTNDTSLVADRPLARLPDLSLGYLADTAAFGANPLVGFNMRNISLNQQLVRVERNRLMPGIVLGFFNQADLSDRDKFPNAQIQFRYRLQFGFSLPVWAWSYKANISGAKRGVEIAQGQAQATVLQLNAEYTKAVALYRNAAENLRYFDNVGLRESQEIIRDARTSYRLGSITYYQYLQNLELAFQIEMNYLFTLKDFNQAIIYLKYLRGEQE
jgi:cobalt-zinc-cadmium resistance protein CzcA